MKTLFNKQYNETSLSLVSLILRVGAGAMMLTHGYPKFQMLFSETIKFREVMGMSASTSLALAVFAEVICSIFLILGLFSRTATIPLIITMLVAVFLIHGDDPFSRQELGLHYVIAYVAILILGSGRFSLDRILSRKK
ncbi:DoxX family protein [Gaetbulibacter aestuarii]|uniref:DoxX family protein n=1 Tax=Gaetbulibacter aestuarii TaxID=1502358 RepID=A0ABW7N0E8_9FLAO